MTNTNIISLNKSEEQDPLQDILQQGAKQLLAQAVEAEIETFLTKQNENSNRKATVVRNGYLPERTLQTGFGDIEVKIPKTRDRSGSGLKFNSVLIPPYLKRTQSIEEFLPWLYLKGIFTGNFSESLKHLLERKYKI